MRDIGRYGIGVTAVLGLAAVLCATPRPLGAAAGASAGAAATALQQDAAEDLYRAGREALNRGRYMEAAELLARLSREHPAWDRAGDALYWNAYAHYRVESYDRALASLERLVAEFPDAAERGDAEALRVRIEGALARRGDAEAAARIAERAGRATAIEAEVAQRMAERAARTGERAARRAETTGRQAELAARELELAERGRLAYGQEACGDTDVQNAALNALMMMDAERALPVLERVLSRRDECSEPLRVQATWLLAQKGGDQADNLLLEVVRQDPSPEVRGQAVFWLSRVEGDGAVTALEEVLASEGDPELHNNALFALARHPSERAFEVLRSYALDESKPAADRSQAVFWLSRHERFEDIDGLIELYGSLSSVELKEQVLHAASQNAEDPAAVDWLLGRVLDEQEPTQVRKQALFWAGQAGVDVERLDGLYERLTDREMKEQLVFVYSRSDDAAAVDRLIEIARAESDAEIRKQAIFWLGRSDDPRAAEYLVQLLESP